MSITLKYYCRPIYIISAGVILSLLDIISVLLRVWTRKKQRQRLLADDWLMIPASLLTTIIGGCLVYGVSQEAFGYPTKIDQNLTGNPLEISSEQLSTAFKIEFLVICMIPLTLGCTKASFLLFYRRIFSIDQTVDRFLIWFIVLVSLWTVGFLFTTVFECGLDFWVLWGTNSSAKNITSHCVNTQYMSLIFGVTDFITDVVIIGIPIPLIWRLSLSVSKKIAIISVFLLGGVTIGASLARLLVITRDVHADVTYNPYEDQILVITEYLYWGMIECSIGVFAACLPTLRYLVHKLSIRTVIDSTRSLFGSFPSALHYGNNSQENIYANHSGNSSSYTKTQNRQRFANLRTYTRANDASGVTPLPRTESHPLRYYQKGEI
ncbi:uncharacterized protein GGS22DRAFT_150763 [Annulohypoxylon maeteangense]|uniref:uncharacterized protein n=1 Tax=Annulohypoxylon maeteangense TaxID=1927788 RepID=UPI002007C757|nr:uncharacterized protein GGS22DRAFT_150763 [Annulohypoxylon maeteangense]KAI0890386.1 hypothetical protein GGS22DRAFT_150763 [Annulohypoxylon maeteangense]